MFLDYFEKIMILKCFTNKLNQERMYICNMIEGLKINIKSNGGNLGLVCYP